MKDRVAEYLEHFDFDFADEGMRLSLGEDAPEELRRLVQTVCGGYSPECLTCLYEALTVISETGEERSEIDEKVCPIDIYLTVLNFLRAA